MGESGGDALAGLFKMMSRIKEGRSGWQLKHPISAHKHPPCVLSIAVSELVLQYLLEFVAPEDLTTEASDAVLLGFAPPEDASLPIVASSREEAAEQAQKSLKPGPQ